MRPPNGEEDLVFLPTVAYLRPPASAARGLGLPAGKTWIAAGLIEPPARSVPQWVLGVESLNPAFVLSEVQWGAESAAPIGQQTIGKAQASGFLVHVDLEHAATHASGVFAASFFQTIGYEVQSFRGGAHPKASRTVSVQVWLDRDGHIAQFEASPPGASRGAETMTIRSVGAPVRVSTPPHDQIVDIAAIQAGSGAGYSSDGDADDG